MAETDWQWWAGRDEEFYTSGPYSSREAAIESGHADFCDDEYFVIICAQSHGLKLDATRLLDDQYFEADDLFDGEHSEAEWRCSKEHRKEAVAALQEALDAWVRNMGGRLNAPSMFAATRSFESIKVIADD